MNFPKLQARVVGMLKDPTFEWRTISAEPDDIQSLYMNYIVPLAAIPAVAKFLGLGVVGVPFLGRVGFFTALVTAIVVFLQTLIAQLERIDGRRAEARRLRLHTGLGRQCHLPRALSLAADDRPCHLRCLSLLPGPAAHDEDAPEQCRTLHARLVPRHYRCQHLPRIAVVGLRAAALRHLSVRTGDVARSSG